MSRSDRRCWIILLCLLVLCPPLVVQGQDVNGRIVAQELEAGQGYTVLHVWGSHYEMGYAHGYLMAEYVELAYQQYLSAFGYAWPAARSRCENWTFLPAACEEEIQGIVDAVHEVYPASTMDALDLKVACTFGDWAYAYACRSTSCWGELVGAPYGTLSARKLQFMVLPPSITQQWHHVICAWEPSDDSPCWVNCAFPGYVSAVTAVNEFGTAASLHDWNSSTGPDHPEALPRTMACRYALTMELGPDPATHLDTVFGELGRYEIATGGFLNYYVPAGAAGVIKTSKTLGFYDVRRPQPEWMDGHVISTNNSDIDGRTGISPWAPYYLTLDPPGGATATMAGLWDTAFQSTDMHILVLGCRGWRDMTLWFTGRLQVGNLARLELEWSDLFAQPGSCDDPSHARAVWPPARPSPARAGQVVALTCDLPQELTGARLLVHDLSGRRVAELVEPRWVAPSPAGGVRLVFDWDGRDEDGRPIPSGLYLYRVAGARRDHRDVAAPFPPESAGRLVWIDR